MHKRLTFRHMDSSEVLEKYANKQLAKIEDFLQNERTPIYIDLVMEPSKTREHHKIELRVKTPNYDLVTNYEGPKFYDVLDHVIDTMYHNLHEAKRKEIDQKKESGRPEKRKWEE